MANSSSFTSILSSRAQKEITQAWNWYEERQQGLGDRFVKEVIARIHKMSNHLSDIPPGTNTITKLLFLYFPS